MNKLVRVIQGDIVTTSNIVGNEFGIAHNELMRKIENLTVEISTVRFSEMYEPHTYVNARGREYQNYLINRDGYMFLVMNISTKKAHSKKLAFIDAFNAMETVLLKYESNQADPEWKTLRSQTKAVRKQETDAIKLFTEYATQQGSQSAKWYYKHVTNATYGCLNLIQEKQPKLRDTLDILELATLASAEHVARQSLLKHMDEGEHYKAIFVMVKQDLETFAKALMLPEL